MGYTTRAARLLYPQYNYILPLYITALTGRHQGLYLLAHELIFTKWRLTDTCEDLRRVYRIVQPHSLKSNPLFTINYGKTCALAL